MSGIFLGWIGFVIALAVTFLAVRIFLLIREVSNRLMVKASKDFHLAASALLDDSHDLSDESVSFIDRMNRSACSGKGHYELLGLLREFRKSGAALNNNGRSFEGTLGDMRTELKGLFSKAIVSWLSYLIHQNVVVGIMIMIEVRRLELRSDKVGQSPEKQGFAFLKRMDGHTC